MNNAKSAKFDSTQRDAKSLRYSRRPLFALLAALFAAFPASAVSHADFGRLDGSRVVRAPLTLAVRVVTTNEQEVVTKVETPAEDAPAVSTNAAIEATADTAAPTATYAVTNAAVFVTNTVTTIATNTVVRRDTRLSAADYLAQGWKRVIDDKPAASADGKIVVATGWTETDETITRQYAEQDAPAEVKIPRKFSKLKIYGAIAQLGAWEKVRAWLEAKEIDGVNGWTAFTLAQEVSEDHALFAPLAEEARQLIGLDEAAFEALLSSCVLEEGY